MRCVTHNIQHHIGNSVQHNTKYDSYVTYCLELHNVVFIHYIYLIFYQQMSHFFLDFIEQYQLYMVKKYINGKER